MKQPPTPAKNTGTPTPYRVLLIPLLCGAVIGAVIVNFMNKIHYSNLLNQANGLTASAQNELAKERYDLTFLVQNSTGPLNCYDLHSTYARSVCTTHDQANTKQ